MKCLPSATLTILTAAIALGAKDTKQSLRAELVERERSGGYSLVEWPSGSGSGTYTYVVSPLDRTLRKVRVKDSEAWASAKCTLLGEHYSLFWKDGIWLRDDVSGETQTIDKQGRYSRDCFSPARKIVYTAGKTIRVYDLATKASTDVAEGRYPAWSPDGKWLGFDDGKHFVLMDGKSGARRKLFGTKNSMVPSWSPDSRYLTYVKTGGSGGGFLFWGIKCIEPYRVWVWRVADGAHDWVAQVCKGSGPFLWAENSQLSYDAETH